MEFLRGAAAGALVGFAGNWNGPTVFILAIVAALVIFDLGRRDRDEQIGPAGVAALTFVETFFPPIPSEVVMPLAGVAAARACAHNATQSKAGFSQPRSSAGQTSLVRSAPQAGNSDQSTGTQRARARTMVALTIGTFKRLVATTGVPLPAGVGAPAGGPAQPASHPRITVDSPALQRVRTFDMWVLFLEAFGAVLLLALIVWWTMFHGRSKGERDRDIR